MFLRIGAILSPHERSAILETLAKAEFEDGRRTAGWHAKQVKRNEQAGSGPVIDTVLAKVKQALLAHDVFVAAARPKNFVKLLVSRYGPGMTYGTHVDDALMDGQRTDLSFTLFLSDPAHYKGGELVIEDSLEDRSIKLQAGELILYPSATLHRVEPVTQGMRLAVVGWLRSYVRDPARREVLFDLELTLRELFERDGKTAIFDRLVKTRTNLLRLWAED
ncbi:MAG TPA: Fe2+-dependent dioxygenase [Aestuariivirgaceae bacterium]|jgi:PKHD-type hydroxylase